MRTRNTSEAVERRYFGLLAVLPLLACGASKKPVATAANAFPPRAPVVAEAAANADAEKLLGDSEFALVMAACTSTELSKYPLLKIACDAGTNVTTKQLDDAFSSAAGILDQHSNGDTTRLATLQLTSATHNVSSEIRVPSVVDVVSRGLEQYVIDRVKIELQRLALDILGESLSELQDWMPATFKLLVDTTDHKQSLAETLRATLVRDILGLPQVASRRLQDHVEARIVLSSIAAFLHGGDITTVLQQIAADAPDPDWKTTVNRALALAQYVRNTDVLESAGLLLAYADRRAAALAASAFKWTHESEIIEVIAIIRNARRSLHAIGDVDLADETRARSIAAVAEQLLAAVETVGRLRGKEPTIDRGAVVRAVSAVASQDLPSFVAEVIAQLPRDQVNGTVRQFMSMGAELSHATTPDAIANTLASFTTGTTNVRRGVTSIRIGGLVGPGIGYRSLRGDGVDAEYDSQLGFSALLGIEASYPVSQKYGIWLGVFLSGVDALAAATLQGDAKLDGSGASVGAKFNARSLIAPGAALEFGVRNFTIAGSFTVLPDAIGVHLADRDQNVTVVRALLNIGISIPLFELGSF